MNATRSRGMRSKGRVTVARQLSVFKVGTRVRISVDPSRVHGRPSTLRFNNHAGVVEARQGNAFKVRVMDGNKPKTLFVTAVHLERV